jgi:hypothetical protein
MNKYIAFLFYCKYLLVRILYKFSPDVDRNEF